LCIEKEVFVRKLSKGGRHFSIVMYCVHRSTTAAVRLSNVLIKTRSVSKRGIRTSNLAYSADGIAPAFASAAAPIPAPTPPTRLDEFLPEIADFPARHIGPRKHDATAMLEELGYEVKRYFSYKSSALGK